jgi:hypothetical protein
VAIEFLVVGHAGLAVGKADLRGIDPANNRCGS